MTYRSPLVALLLAFAAGCGDNHDASPPDAPPIEPPPRPELGTWRDRFVLPGLSGTQARVEDLVRGPDNRVYAGGIFTDAAGVAVENVAAWDGERWHRIGEAPGAWVRALGFDASGALWAAAGEVDTSRSVLARLEGDTWRASPSVDGELTDLAIVPAGVVGVGTFTDAGGSGAGGVALFDGAQWRPLGSGAIDGVATAVAVTADGVCVAGAFGSIGGVDAENAACWDGQVWAPLGSNLPGGVTVLVRSPDGRWFAGGTLTFVLDDGGYRAGIAVLDPQGRWVPFEGGIDVGAVNHVRTIAFDGDAVVVGGNFGVAGSGRGEVEARNLARFRPGAGWSEVAGGIRNDIGYHSPAALGPYALLADPDGTVWIGGLFSRAGDVPAVSVAAIAALLDRPVALTGVDPVLGIGGFVDAVAIHDGRVLAAGGFRFAGPTGVSAIARLDGESWSGFGDGVVDGVVRDVLVRRDGRIAICGDLGLDGRAIAFAQWDGQAWTATGEIEGGGFAMFEDAQGRLWLGGELARTGDTALANLARLDGEVWSPAGAFDGRVTSLTLHLGAMYAGGLFSTADGRPARGLAQLGSSGWHEHGGVDPLGYVSVLASHPTLGLLVGGGFSTIGGEPIPSLAAWNGERWRSLGALDGSLGPSFVSALEPFDRGVFVGGGFERAGGVAAARVAWFDGHAWHALGAGLDDHAEAFVVEGDTLWIGGPFTAAGGEPSSGLATWSLSPAP